MDMQQEYYLKPKRFVECRIADAAPVVREVWDLFLRKACFEPARIEGGEWVCSYEVIRDSLSWRAGWRPVRYSKGQIDKAIRRLKREGVISTRKTLGGMVVTVLGEG